MISVINLADEIGVRKQTIFKVAKRLGIETQKLRTEQGRGQLVAHLSSEDAEAIRDAISVSDTVNDDDPEASASGWFYIIQLEPTMDPGRIKLGFAIDVEQRLRSHRTSAPFSALVQRWPCKALWEKTAIDCISTECERLHTEVFRTQNLHATTDLADSFFSIMPDPNGALLHKAFNTRDSPFPGRIHPTASVTGMPRAV